MAICPECGIEAGEGMKRHWVWRNCIQALKNNPPDPTARIQELEATLKEIAEAAVNFWHKWYQQYGFTQMQIAHRQLVSTLQKHKLFCNACGDTGVIDGTKFNQPGKSWPCGRCKDWHDPTEENVEDS